MDPALEIEMAAMSRQKAMNDVIGLGDSEIQRFYNNSVVFLTGGSGFLGKQLIEKLLRSCNVSKMFLLLRSKKGRDAQQRLDEILNDPVFNMLREQKPDFIEKLVIIEGDVADIRLAIKDDDWKSLTAEVKVIFHVAAVTKFDETLKVATLINVRGTREILRLGKACKKLKAFVHVSTTWSHATTKRNGLDIKEQFYNTCVTPETLISMVETMDEQRLIEITPALIKDWPITYTFTKAIAEEQVRIMSAGLPICIVRPAVVLSCYSEPSPGWLDISCIYGITGLLLGSSLGLMHGLPAKCDTELSFVPCDYVNNAIIAVGKETASSHAKGGNETKIYAVISNPRNPITCRNFINIFETHLLRYPTPSAIAYVYGYATSSKFTFTILFLFLHLIPAYIADFICLLMGKKRRFTKVAKKFYTMSNFLSYFSTKNWKYTDDNLNKLFARLSNRDKTIFKFDITDVDWVDYILIWLIGTRKYIIKDGLKDTTYAIKKQKILRIVHYVFMALCMYTIWKLFNFVLYIGSNLF